MRRMLLVACLAVACTPKQAVTAVVDISNAVCTELQQQDPSDPYINFTCSLIDAGGGITKTFLAKVHKDDAAGFRVRHCTEAGKPTP